MIPRLKTPYEKFPDITKRFCDAVIFRTASARQAIDLLDAYRKKKPRASHEYQDFKSIRYIMARFAVLELCVLLDGSGELSLKLDKTKFGKYSGCQEAKLKKLFPSLPSDQRSDLKNRIDDLIARYSGLIAKLLHSRHRNIAHAVVKGRQHDGVTLSSIRFPKLRCYKFSHELELLVWEISLGFKPLTAIDVK